MDPGTFVMLRLLSPQTRSQLRSSVAICSPCQCVDELVLNSLDSGATCVAVRVDLSKFWIQVVDNGDGITENDMEKIGTRYMTSKCHSLDDLQNLCHYGYRGEALASIREISKNLEIQTRGKSSSVTFSVEFAGNKSGVVSKYPYSRPSSGTTVTVDDLFHSLPVRKKCFGKYLELERIREKLEAFSLIHPNVSISLRNDAAGCVILQSRKSSSTLGAFTHIFGGKLAKGLVEISNEEDGCFKVSGYFGREGHTNRNIQYVFVNGRLVLKSKIHKTLNVLLCKSLIVQKNTRGKEQAVPVLPSSTNFGSPGNEKELYPVFVVKIDCPLSEYDITFDPAKTLVEFRDWNALLERLQSLVGDFLRRENLLMRIEKDVSEDYKDYVKGYLSSDEAVQETDGEEQVTEHGPAGYGEGINSYDRSNCLASGTARRAIAREEDAEDAVTDNGLSENSCCGDNLLTLQQRGLGKTDDGCKIESILGDKPLGDVTSDQHDVTSAVKSVKDSLDLCDQICADEDTLPTPKGQSEAERNEWCKETNVKDKTWNIKNDQMFLKSNDESITILDSSDDVTTKDCHIVIDKSRCELNTGKDCHKSEGRSIHAVKETTQDCLKRKKLHKKYVDISSSTDSERTPDYSVHLPDIGGRKNRRMRLRCQKRLSCTSSSDSIKKDSVGKKDCEWKRPHSKRKSITSSQQKISAQGHLKQRTSKRKSVNSSKKKISDRELARDGIPKSKRPKVTGQTTDEKHVSYGYDHDQGATGRHSRVSKQLGVTFLESPSTLFHRKRTRSSSKRTSTCVSSSKRTSTCASSSKRTSTCAKEKASNRFNNPNDATTVSSRSHQSSKRLKNCEAEQKDIAEEHFASFEADLYEDENPMETIQSDDVPTREIPAEVCASDHSSLWKFRQEKRRLEPLALSQSGGSRGCTQTVRTSRLWRRIRKMYKKTPALMKCLGYNRNQENIDHICNSYNFKQDNIIEMFRAPIKQASKKMVTETIPKETLADIIYLEADLDDTGQSKTREYKIPERRERRSNEKDRKDLNEARADDVPMSGFKMDTDTGRSKRTSGVIWVQPHAGNRISEQGQIDYFSDSKFDNGTELHSEGIPQMNYRPPIFREDVSRTDCSDEYCYKSRCSADAERCHTDQYHMQFDNQLDSSSRYRCFGTGFQGDTRKRTGEEYPRKWCKQFEVDRLGIDQNDIRRTRPVDNVCSNTIHCSVGGRDGLCPLFSDEQDCIRLADVDSYQEITEQKNLYQSLIEQNLDQSSHFKQRDRHLDNQGPKKLYQDLTDKSSKAEHCMRDFLSVASVTVDPVEDGRSALPDGSCSPYFCPLQFQRISSKDVPSYGTGRYFEIGRSATGFRDSLPVLGTKKRPCEESDLFAGTRHQIRPNLSNDNCDEKGFENRGKSQQVITSSSVHHSDHFGKNIKQSEETISGHSNPLTSEKFCQIYDAMDGGRCVSKTRNSESDLIALGWLPRKKIRNSRQRTNNDENTMFYHSPMGQTSKFGDTSDDIHPVESVALIPEPNKSSGYCKRLNDPRTSAVKGCMEAPTSLDSDGPSGSLNLDHVRNMKRFSEVFSMDSGDLEPSDVGKKNNVGRLVGPRNLHMQSQGFDPELSPSGGSVDSDKFPCTQGFDVTIADEQIRGKSSQDRGSLVDGFPQGFDNMLPERENPTKHGPLCANEFGTGVQGDNIVKDSEEESDNARYNHLMRKNEKVKQMEKRIEQKQCLSSSSQDENEAKIDQTCEKNTNCRRADILSDEVAEEEFCVFTPSITDIINRKNKKERSLKSQVENMMSQPRGKKLLLQRYNEETEKMKVSKIGEKTEKLPDESSTMARSFNSTGREDENGVKSIEKDNLKSMCDSNFPFLSWHQCGVSHTESLGGKTLGTRSKSDFDAAQNFEGNLGDEIGHRQAHVLDEDEAERTKTPESEHLVSECLSDILQDCGEHTQMSDVILKKHTPEWLKCSQAMLTQSVIVHRHAYDLEASQSILPRECIDVTRRDKAVYATTQGQSSEISKTCFDGSEDLFSTWPSLSLGQDISRQAPNKARETVPNDDDFHTRNSTCFDTQILPSAVGVAMPQGSHYGHWIEADAMTGSLGIVENSGTSKPNTLSRGKPSAVEFFPHGSGGADNKDRDSSMDSRRMDFTGENITSSGRDSRPATEIVTSGQKDSNVSELKTASDLIPRVQPKEDQERTDRGNDCSSGVDATVVKEVMETSGGCCAYTCMIDPKSGRTMYIHLATGNTTYEKPTFTNRPPELMQADNEDKTKGGFTQHRFLSHGASPVMPRPKAERKAGLSAIPSEKIAKLLEVHKEKQDMDKDVKWRQDAGEDGSSIEKMFKEWDNPIFKEAPQEVMSIEMAGERRSVTKVHNSLQSFKFTKDVFHGSKVIEQVDQKFIACLMSMDDKTGLSDPEILVFVDQHAAHERIRLEKSIMDLYDGEENMKSVLMKPPMQLMVGTQQVRAMAAQERSFKKIGINFRVEKPSRDTVLVERVPKCLSKQGKEDGEKYQATRCSPVSEEAVMDLLREHAETLQRSSGAAGAIPNPILKLLWSQACHGAIKFGDGLSHAECEDLITSLSACNLPFQCAHGRPSMVPIIDLRELDKRLIVERRIPNLRRLKKLVEMDKAIDQQVPLSSIDKKTICS